MKRWLVSLTMVLAAGGGAYLLMSQAPSKREDGENLGVVKRQDLSQRVNVSGAVAPNRTVTFVPPYEGYVRKIYVKLGQTVKAGDPVVKITPGADDEAFPLRAPFDGVVVQVMRTEGQYVSKNKDDAIVRVDDISKLNVESDAPELDYAKLKVGQDVIIKASAIMSRTYKGKITEIAQAARGQDRWERSKVEFPIKVAIVDHDDKLKPGMSVVIDVITEQAPAALTLRHEFIRKEGDNYVVTMANGEKRQIKVGLRNEEAFEVTEGLKEGDQVKPVDFLSM
jgi:multidrug efflux pump subunit AcrA (membrane-fusion protein)